MARTARLSRNGARRRSPSLLLILVAVLAGHALVLYWLAHARAPASLLRPLAAPMFTRLLQPTAPPVVAVAPAPPPAAAARRRPVARHVVPSTPETTTTVASAEPQTPAPDLPAPLPAAPPADAGAAASETGAPVDIAAADGSADKTASEASPPDTGEGAAAAAAEASTTPAADTGRPKATASAANGAPAASGSAEAQAGSPESAADAAASSRRAAGDDAAAAAAAALAPAAALDSWPGDTRLSYELSGRFRSGDLYGSARVQWQREGTRYQTRVEIDLPPWLNQVLTSQGEVGLDSLRPEVYEETRRGKNRGVRLGAESIVLGNGERIARPDGVQDAASQFVELSHRFATGRDRLVVGGSVSLWLVRPGGIDLWTYDIVKRETLKTAQLGEVEAFHLKPRPLARPRGNITAEMWFAPSLQFLPVRIRVTMGTEAEVDLMVSTIEQR